MHRDPPTPEELAPPQCQLFGRLALGWWLASRGMWFFVLEAACHVGRSSDPARLRPRTPGAAGDVDERTFVSYFPARLASVTSSASNGSLNFFTPSRSSCSLTAFSSMPRLRRT